MEIIGTESEIKDICLTIATNNFYCPIMQWHKKKGEAPVDWGCIGTACNTIEQVYECMVKRDLIMVIPF